MVRYEAVDARNGRGIVIEQQIGSLVDPLQPYVRAIVREKIHSPRHDPLRHTADYVLGQSSAHKVARLVFICTHNSRRSHLAHVWAATAAVFHGCHHMEAFSGGTQVTACDPRTVATLRRAGFSVVQATDATNPRYANPLYTNPLYTNPLYLVQAFKAKAPIKCFSKLYNQEGNPTSDFVAMMCCSDVDTNCPLVEGAALRVPLHYDDPKESDGTPHEEDCYDQRCLQIARDMFLLMSMVVHS